ncbi:hypothetical protein C4D60_Mb09t04350 [Musa balbisiana]|uniref:Protein kinase domain-containing protein n=1 Tax=Musa balbisiana TaxID=52838 RepID=A0A4S8IGD3_MUSBA|nr:hypothetical protein C4D60_Mb09t04350 [Musa balbisiana]
MKSLWLGVICLLSLLPLLAESGAATLNDDVLGLIAFKAGIEDPRSKLASWNENDNDPCNWNGIKCDPKSNRVAVVALDGFALSGKLGRGLLRLQFLDTLSLSVNNFSGSLTPALLRLESLRTLDLSANNLSGTIPDGFFGQCRSIRDISLAKNSISGKIPSDVGACSTLASLNLSSNQLSGSLPGEIWSLNALRSLDLSHNSLVGEIPVGISRMFNLRMINLRGNRLTGQLPNDTGECLLLKSLDVGENQLSGDLPESMRNLSTCTYLSLSSNSLSGEVPAWIGDMNSLETLDLSRNRFSGGVPSSLSNLQFLKLLKLSDNSFSGGVPDSLAACRSLDLSQNNLTGSIPETLANLTNLRVVDFSRNRISGTLPKQLSDLPHLLSFNISHNQLSGGLPAGSFFNNIPPSSLTDNPGLCGSTVNRSCPGVLPKPIVLDPNSSPDPSSNPVLSPRNLSHKKIIFSISALIAIVAAAVIALGVITITVLNFRAHASASNSAVELALSDEYLSHSPVTDANSGKLVMFAGGDPEFSAGAHAVLNKDCELGRGGFGAVYKTVLRDGRSVAIKKLTVSSLVKSQEDFEEEVKRLGKVQHPNLVALEGYYWTPSLQLLIYEFVPGGSLYNHLHECSASNTLSWQERFDIILGIARSLAHLHQHKIIHYNLKSSNVLLDGSGEPKVGDCGLAKLLPMLDRYVLSSKIQSALGYMAPEFACQTVKITDKCDVYGFGVLVLEIMTGKRPVEYMEDDVVLLSDMVRETLDEGKVEECMDERLCGKFPLEETIPVMKLGLICTSQVPSNRPEMAEVVNILELIRFPQDSPEEDDFC